MVHSLALMSPNEQLEDIATGDLKFVLVEYYLSLLQQKGESRERILVDGRGNPVLPSTWLWLSTHQTDIAFSS